MKNKFSEYSLSTPFYIFEEKGFIDNFNSLINAMRMIYPNYNIAYSYKTNYTPYICRLAKNLGAYAEVVSDMELELALKLGYANDHIIYNGPAKGPKMEKHILSGGISNIDNLDEVKRVVALAEFHPNTNINIGIRINSDIGTNFASRFGFEIFGEDLKEALRLIKSKNNLHIIGIHMHVSRARGLNAWKKRIENAIIAADSYLDEIPKYIDVGSGMFADMEPYLKEQFKIEVPSYQDYAKVVGGYMAERYKECNNKPMLLTEPGTTVVARYLSLYTRVIGSKSIDNRRMAIVDSDYHQIGETGRMMKCPYTVVRKGEKGDVILPPLDIVGFTCLEQDVLFKSFQDPLAVDDIIQFRNIGAYSIVYKPPFIQPQCPVYSKCQNGEIKLIKRAETFEDIFQTFVF